MNDQDKQQILAELLQIYAHTVDIESALWFSGLSAEANSIEVLNNSLSDAIDQLRADLWGSWKGQAAALLQKITANRKKLEDAISDIKADITNAKKAVKVAGYLDTVIKIAAGLLA